MRNFLRAGNEGLSFYDNNISLEEADVLADEAHVDIAEASGELATAERLMAVSDALEDMGAIVEQIDEPSDTDRALVDTAASLAVAGTDAEPEDVVPAIESFGRAGMESLGDRAKAIFDSVMAVLRKIWEKIEGFFYKIFGAIPRLRESVKAVRKEVEEAGNKTLDKEKKKFKISSTRGITTAEKTAKNGADFKAAVKDSVDVVKWVMESYTAKVASLGEVLSNAVGDFDVDNGEKFTESLHSGVKGFGKFPGEKNDPEKRFAGMTSLIGEALLGGSSLFYRIGDKEGPVLGRMDRIRRSGVIIAPTKTKEKDLPSEVEFETLSVSDCESLLDSADGILDKIETFSRGARAKDISAARKKIEKGSEKAVAAWDKRLQDKDTTTTEQQKALMKSALQFNVAFAGWAKEPVAGTITHGLSVVKTVLAITAKSVACYK